MDKVDKWLRREKSLDTKRGNFPQLWNETTKYCLPDRAKFLCSSTPGSENLALRDTTGVDANIVLAHGLFSNLISPSIRWFKTSIQDQRKKEFWNVKKFISLTV